MRPGREREKRVTTEKEAGVRRGKSGGSSLTVDVVDDGEDVLGEELRGAFLELAGLHVLEDGAELLLLPAVLDQVLG